MKNYIYLDGEKVKISDKTAKNFREQFSSIELKSPIELAIEKIGKFIANDEKILYENDFVKVPLPNCNKEWSLEAFNYAKRFCKAFSNSCPFHKKGQDNDDFIYIKFYP